MLFRSKAVSPPFYLLNKKRERSTKMAKTKEEAKETKAREAAPNPTKIGDSKGGYTLAADPVAGRFMLEKKSGRYGVYTKPWTKECQIVLRPVADKDVAMSVLRTGKVPEKKKEDAPSKK